MRIAFDIETNSLVNPTKIFVIVCKDIDTGTYHIFRHLTEDENEKEKFIAFADKVDCWIGHNVLGYDLPHLQLLCNLQLPDISKICDTLVVSKLVDYPRNGHSIEDYGIEFNYNKIKFNKFTEYSKDMEDYCVRDVDICHRVYTKYTKYISNPKHHNAILLEHQFQLVVNDLHDNGFCIDTKKANSLLAKVELELSILDKNILEAFPPKLKMMREVTPKETKYGTISLTSIPKTMREMVSDLSVDCPFCYCAWSSFNPSSHKQIVDVLNQAGWRPVDKTQTHIDTERAINSLKYKHKDALANLTYEELNVKLQIMKKAGWKVNETNLETLPQTAPASARTLAKRILLEARRRTLTEWLDLVWYEIEIEHDQLGILGIETNGQQTQSFEINKEPRTKDGVSLTSRSQEQVTVKDISNSNTDSHSKTLLEWLKSKKVNVLSAKRNANSTLITVIGKEQYAACSAALATCPLGGTKNILVKYKLTSARIHGKFNGLGAWSHRMNHQNPNTANIPNEYDTAGKKKLYGKELRSLWCAPKNRLLVGVDAEGIQLRIFAHYINDPEFTRALVEGKKENGSDPHTLNQRIMGSVCKTRDAAKKYIYALLFGAGNGKLTEILGCTAEEADTALQRIMARYQGFDYLKQVVIPSDAKRGWFTGLDGRAVRIPGDTVGQRRHLCMSGMLQGGEAVIMKTAALKWHHKLKEHDALLVNFVHDEYVIEVPNDMKVAKWIQDEVRGSIVETGVELKLKCPLAGSGGIGNTWVDIH